MSQERKLNYPKETITLAQHIMLNGNVIELRENYRKIFTDIEEKLHLFDYIARFA